MKKIALTLSLLLIFCLVFSQGERPRTVLLEGFTSATCGPCVSGNINLKNVLAQNTGKYVLIKYQVNFPGVGDPYYTAEIGARRSSFYSVGGVPHLYVDGETGMNTGSFTNTMLNNQQAIPANMDLNVGYYVEGKTVYATATINPAVNMSGQNLKLFMVIVERVTYKNIPTAQWNGEKEFMRVVKKFMPNTDGISLESELTANTPYTLPEQVWEFKGEYRLPPDASSPINHAIEHSVENFDNLTVVAWVQNTQTKEVLQACEGALSKAKITYATVNEHGTVTATMNETTVPQGVLLETGDEVIFKATPNSAYKVKEWVVNGEVVPNNATNEYVTTFDRYLDVTVEFHTTHVDVNYNTVNEYGTLTATANGTPITTGESIERGTKLVFTAAPNDGYRVLAWRNNGKLVMGNMANVYTIESLGDGITVTVEFETTHLTVNYSTFNNDNGVLTAKVDLEEIASGELVARGKRVVFTATHDEGIPVKEWKNNGTTIFGNTTNEYAVVSLSEDVNVIVAFENDNVGIADELLPGINLYPNPFTHSITVTEAEDITKIAIINIYGQTMKEMPLSGANTVVVDMEELATGVYFVIAEISNGKNLVNKIVKIQ